MCTYVHRLHDWLYEVTMDLPYKTIITSYQTGYLSVIPANISVHQLTYILTKYVQYLSVPLYQELILDYTI